MPPISKYWILSRDSRYYVYGPGLDDAQLSSYVGQSLLDAEEAISKYEFFQGVSVSPVSSPPEKTTLTVINEEI